MKVSGMGFLGLIVAGALLAGTVVLGGETAWTGNAGDGNWHTFGNWDNGVPGEGDDATISGSVTVSASTAALASLTQAGGTLTFQGWNTVLTADTVMIEGTVTHDVNTDTSGTAGNYESWTPNNRVQIVGGDVTVNGSIQASFKGYQGASSAGGGYGPGANTHERGGAAYGGINSPAAFSDATPYGSLTEPVDPGSGGSRDSNGTAGPGGGAVRIDVTGTVRVDGVIAVDGTSGQGSRSSGGSGGSIWINAQVLEGSGEIRANGGNGGSTTDEGGSGGRIAIYVDPSAHALIPLQTLNITAMRGSSSDGRLSRAAQDGTIYLTSSRLIPAEPTNMHGRFFSPMAWDLTYDNWIVTDSKLRFDTNMTLTVAQDMVLDGSFFGFDTAGIVSSSGWFGGRPTGLNAGAHDADLGMVLSAQNLLLTNASRFEAFAGVTNETAHGYGARVDIGQSLSVTGESVLTPKAHPTNGAAVFFTAATFLLSEGSVVDGFRCGYQAGYGSSVRGHDNAGAGYGGRGGGTANNPQYGGTTYGDALAPTQPGSGALTRAGGGVFWLEANVVTLDGVVTMRGQDGGSAIGGGSGGAVYIRCRQIEGGPSATIDASGGDVSSNAGAGGGGRVAVYFNTDLYGVETVNVAGGINTTVAGSPENERHGEPGTVVWEQEVLPAGTVITIH